MVRAHPAIADRGSSLTRLMTDSAETNTVNSREWPEGWAKVHLVCRSSGWGDRLGLGEAGQNRIKMVC